MITAVLIVGAAGAVFLPLACIADNRAALARPTAARSLPRPPRAAVNPPKHRRRTP